MSTYHNHRWTTERHTLSFHGSSNAPDVSVLVFTDMTKMTRREGVKDGLGSEHLDEHFYADPNRA